jgi:integrase
MASIRKHRNKWQVQVRRAGHPAASRSFIQKADAMAWARQVEGKIDTGDLIADLGLLNRISVRDLLIRYKDTITPLKRGAKVESYKISQLLRHGLAECSLRVLTPSVIARYRDERLQNVRPGTVLRELAILRHCFEVARREWDIPIAINPVSQIAMPKASRPRERRLIDDEMGALLRGCDRGQSPLLKPLICFAIETGMRRGEIVALCWSDLDAQCKTLFVPMSKNGHSRTIPLTPAALEIFSELPRDDDRVFPISANAIRLAWGRLKKRAGVVDLRFHDLRHEAISRFFEMGLSVPEVALISGHKDTRTLFHYTHLKAEDVANKLQQIASRSPSQ